MNVPAQSNPTQKKRHGCLTAWLILIIVGNALSTMLVAGVSSIVSTDIEGWVVGVDIALGVWAIICAIALFRWKKWGFWGFLGGACVSMSLNLTSGAYLSAFTPFISIAILYGILQIGGDNKGWPQLE